MDAWDRRGTDPEADCLARGDIYAATSDAVHRAQ